MMYRLFSLVFLLLLTLFSLAQNSVKNGAEMADTLRSSGKIYVVVAVILTIFAGIILYLIRLEKKISKLEKDDQ